MRVFVIISKLRRFAGELLIILTARVDLALSVSAHQRAPFDLARYWNRPPNLGQLPTMSLSWNSRLSPTARGVLGNWDSNLGNALVLAGFQIVRQIVQSGRTQASQGSGSVNTVPYARSRMAPHRLAARPDANGSVLISSTAYRPGYRSAAWPFGHPTESASATPLPLGSTRQ